MRVSQSTNKRYCQAVPDPQLEQLQARHTDAPTGKRRDTVAGKPTKQRMRPSRARGSRRTGMNFAQTHSMLKFATLHLCSKTQSAQQTAELMRAGRPDHQAPGGTSRGRRERQDSRPADGELQEMRRLPVEHARLLLE